MLKESDCEKDEKNYIWNETISPQDPVTFLMGTCNSPMFRGTTWQECGCEEHMFTSWSEGLQQCREKAKLLQLLLPSQLLRNK
jgi:hypothetical protein